MPSDTPQAGRESALIGGVKVVAVPPAVEGDGVGNGGRATTEGAVDAAEAAPVVMLRPPTAPSSSSLPTRAQVVQNFMQLMLSFASLPGFYGVDEEESEMTLGFWYAFQDTLWDVEVPAEDQAYQSGGSDGMMTVSKTVYAQLVTALRNKVRWPHGRSGWAKGR